MPALVPTPSHMYVKWKLITKEILAHFVVDVVLGFFWCLLGGSLFVCLFYTLCCSNRWQFTVTPAHIWHSPDACGFHQPCSLRQESKAKQAGWHPANPKLSGCSLPQGMWSGGRRLCNGHVGTRPITASAFSIISSLIFTQLASNRFGAFASTASHILCCTCCWGCRFCGRGKVFINKRCLIIMGWNRMLRKLILNSLSFTIFKGSSFGLDENLE